MTTSQKEKLLQTACEHVKHVCRRIDAIRTQTIEMVGRALHDAESLKPVDQFAAQKLAEHMRERVKEFDHLKKSPYFVRCDIRNNDSKDTTYYFSRFQLSEESIYSWIAPAATLRFESPGTTSYVVDGKTHVCKLQRKDNYMIVDGEITFFSTETETASRELVYQKDFTTRKKGFILPEIVEQMERAQDQVIRADHRGSFVISGPAGSGKTTLALHRMAYLMLSPDTAPLFPSSRMIVFVQDTGSKEYFSHLLPDLGIKDVAITTFAEWACAILGIPPSLYVSSGDHDTDFYEYEKIQALANWTPTPLSSPFTTLSGVYTSHLSGASHLLFSRQKKEGYFDRIDLTALLLAYRMKYGILSLQQEYYLQEKNGSLKKKSGRLPLTYSLILADEFQNYLPQQLQLLKTCASDNSRGLLYVGDFAQQTQFGTLREWADIGEHIPAERTITLGKVYRNTKKILSYIQSLGYSVTIPENMREGVDVGEFVCRNEAEEFSHVQDIVTANQSRTIGILSYSKSYLQKNYRGLTHGNTVFLKTMHEAQGVEFDIVCIVGMNKEMFCETKNDAPDDFHREARRIKQDLLYVALTRAMDELYIFETIPLQIL